MCPTLCDPIDYILHGFSRPEYWSGYPLPSPGDLPNPGIEPRPPALQVDSLPAEPQGYICVTNVYNQAFHHQTKVPLTSGALISAQPLPLQALQRSVQCHGPSRRARLRGPPASGHRGVKRAYVLRARLLSWRSPLQWTYAQFILTREGLTCAFTVSSLTSVALHLACHSFSAYPKPTVQLLPKVGLRGSWSSLCQGTPFPQVLALVKEDEKVGWHH